MSTTVLESSAVEAQTPQEITQESKSNFALSFLFLPKAKRKGITDFYAFSRVVDDAVDDYKGQEARSRIDFWKKEVALCYEGAPTHPVTLSLQNTIRRFHIPKKYLEDLVEGCEWDLSKNRYPTYEDLYQYCYRVAGCIGLVCMKIFGLEGEDAEKAAEELGVALQLTNILRDIVEDAQRDRIYIPQEDLKRYRLTEAELIEGSQGPKLHTLLKLMAERSEVLYQRAFTKMKQLPRRPLVAAWIMGRVYYEILQKIKKKNFDVYGGKIKLSKLARIRIAAGEWWRSLVRS
ncbi:MAG: presqualene diphosphate synthase HpnD [bacterium]|nr:presqualene diphosphate synthase HpnD [bacterium]